ncbi:MAG: hypothetical protein M3Q09_06420, partial [Gemmatimonadota bacterium]|nr:hypothetical protein [Gemmatimonadota bacterium]
MRSGWRAVLVRNGWHIELDGSSDEGGGWSRGIDLNFSYRPGDQWDVSLDPSYERSEQSRQYVTAISGGRAETFRTRYVFAHVVLRWEWRPGSTMFVVWQ